jgi:hypothetical protein
MRRIIESALLAGLVSLVPGAASAQFLEPGAEAPDVEFTVASAEGVGETMTLSEYRGEVIVLAFFFRARTSG